MSNNSARAPYAGSEVGLVVSIDLGTTFSGTSWAFLDPNQHSQIWDVSGFPGQEYQASSTKVPTVLLYDRGGKLQAAGSQTLDPQVAVKAQCEEWVRVEWFKLLLNPQKLQDAMNRAPEINLPENKTIVDVVGDFFAYIVGLSHRHFLEKMVGSREIWEQVKNRVQYVLSHPNGWNTSQHVTLREAAIKGGLIPDSDEGNGRISFVSEGEASLHWCMNEGLGRKNFVVGSDFVVVDAGGGTIDVSSFQVTSLRPLKFKESAPPESYLVGSVFVTQAFRQFAQDKLASSRYGDSENIERMVHNFDQRVKCTFRDRSKRQMVEFGGRRENDAEFNILAGGFMFEGSDMAQFFERSCQVGAGAVRLQVAPGPRTTVVVVGGFAASPYLFSELENRLPGLNVEFLRADSSTAKAAANGAIGFYLDQYVSARVAKWTYGVECSVEFQDSNIKHINRRSKAFTDQVNGKLKIPSAFQTHLVKGTAVEATTLTRFPFYQCVSERKNISIATSLKCYRGDMVNIEFQDEDKNGSFDDLCTFTAVIPRACLVRKHKSGLRKALKIGSYWECNYHLAVSFGATEFKCFVEWKDEKGNLQCGLAKPVWNEG